MSGYSERAADGFAYSFAGEPVVSERSAFQQIDIWDVPAFGKVLVLDGLTQTTERDEFCYHEMLVHVPLLAHPEPRNVLVIGGGDGGTLRRVLEHPTVQRCTMIEIDERVTALCREHMPSVSAGAFDDPRAHVRFDDGIAFVRDTSDRFDVIIVDSSDPVGPGEGLFTVEFYRNAAAHLTDGGLMCVQAGSPYFQQDEMHRTYGRMREAFPDVRIFLGNVPTYPGTIWGFALAGSSIAIDTDVAAKRAHDRGIRARYWTPEVQRGAFDLPQIVHDVIDPDGPPHTWGSSPEEHVRHDAPGG